MYYPVNNDPVQFVAYCPYDANAVTNSHKVTYDFSDQSTQAKKEAVDFLFHKRSTEHRRSPNTSVALSFNHKFSKIKIHILQGTSGLSCANFAATLTNMPASAEVDLAALALNPDDLTAITPSSTTAPTIPIHRLSSSTATEAIFEAIVPYHTGTDYPGREFVFNDNGLEYIYRLPNTFDFTTDVVHEFRLTITEMSAAPLDSYDGLSNCYLIAPGGNKTIPITRAITIGGMDEAETATLDVLWKDADIISGTPTLSGSGASRTLQVTATSTQGNAVIALKGSDGTIYWSWHIWVSTYANQTISQNNYQFMDRNLGATDNTFSLEGYGLLYQWGRKDPFPGGVPGTAGYIKLDKFKGMPGAGTSADDEMPVYTQSRHQSDIGIRKAILESIKKPTTYFSGSGLRNQWLPLASINLWCTTTIKKSVYDPCPDGYRMPILRDKTTYVAGTGASLSAYPWTHGENISRSYDASMDIYSWGKLNGVIGGMRTKTGTYDNESLCLHTGAVNAISGGGYHPASMGNAWNINTYYVHMTINEMCNGGHVRCVANW
jgi:hypothetical protein